MRLFEVDLPRLLPPGDPRTTRIVQFMAAANDTITAGILFTNVDEGNSSAAERCLAAARRNYFFRLACGHLYEGLCAFRQAVRDEVLADFVPHLDDEGRESYDVLLREADPANHVSFFYRILHPMRNRAVFHYNQEDFARVIADPREPLERSFFVLGPVLGQSRFIVADDVATRLVEEITGSPDSQQAKEAVGVVAQLQGSLGKFIHHLLIVLLGQYPRAVRETTEWP